MAAYNSSYSTVYQASAKQLAVEGTRLNAIVSLSLFFFFFFFFFSRSRSLSIDLSLYVNIAFISLYLYYLFIAAVVGLTTVHIAYVGYCARSLACKWRHAFAHRCTWIRLPIPRIGPPRLHTLLNQLTVFAPPLNPYTSECSLCCVMIRYIHWWFFQI